MEEATPPMFGATNSFKFSLIDDSDPSLRLLAENAETCAAKNQFTCLELIKSKQFYLYPQSIEHHQSAPTSLLDAPSSAWPKTHSTVREKNCW